MNISPLWTCKWSKSLKTFVRILTPALALAFAAATPAQKNDPALKPLLPFLEEFKTPPIAVSTTEVAVATALGRLTGVVARPDTSEKLPAVLLIHDRRGLGKWMRKNVPDLAGVGYVVLAVHVPVKDTTPERTLAELSAAVRWLRHRADVLPERIGVVGWCWGGEQALALAASTPVQACVMCGGAVTADAATLAGLRGTPVFGVFANKKESRGSVRAFQKALQDAKVPHRVRLIEEAGDGFMNPEDAAYAHDAAEEAWVDIYEFLGKYVEDAEAPPPPSKEQKRIATIADIMRAVNDGRGVRGSLIQELSAAPTTARQWARIRSHAALIAEAGHLLRALTPRKGAPGHWASETKTFSAAAESVVAAADRQDYGAVKAGLEQLGKRCAACHERHR
jgi:carboxymethylenebutenolidase